MVTSDHDETATSTGHRPAGRRRRPSFLGRLAAVAFAAILLAGFATASSAGASVAAGAQVTAAAVPAAGTGACTAYQYAHGSVFIDSNGNVYQCKYFPGLGYFWEWIGKLGPSCPNTVNRKAAVSSQGGAAPAYRTCG